MQALEKTIQLLYRKNNTVVTTTLREIGIASGLEPNEFKIWHAIMELRKEKVLEILTQKTVSV